MNKSVILYGPAGSGKTAIAERLAKHLGLRYVVEDWNERNRRIGLVHNALYVTNQVPHQEPGSPRVVSIDEAKRMLGELADDNSDDLTISTTARCLSDLDKLKYEASLFGEQFHRLAKAAGWYNDPKTGEPLVRNHGEMLALIHSEISEALEGERKNKMDDHLPHRKAAEVELADALIRIFDYAGYCGYDVIGAAVEKCAYNAKREDHKPENRRKAGGKAF